MDPRIFHFSLSTQLISVGDLQVVGKHLGSLKLVVFWEDTVPKGTENTYIRTYM